MKHIYRYSKLTQGIARRIREISIRFSELSFLKSFPVVCLLLLVKCKFAFLLDEVLTRWKKLDNLLMIFSCLQQFN